MNKPHEKRTHNRRTVLRRAASLLLALIAVLSVSLPSAVRAEARVREADARSAGTVGLDVSGFSALDVFGNTVTGSVFADKQLTVIHYFATWSWECIREMDYMQTAYDSFFEEINVFGLLFTDASSTPEACAKLMENYGFTYDCLIPDEVLSQLTEEYALIPQTFFINSSGVVVEHYPGTFGSADELIEIIEERLGHTEQHFSVTFTDGLTGEVIKREAVPAGGSAVPPEPPVHAGYLFSDWDGSWENVTENRIITSIYVIDIDYFPKGDVDMDCQVTVLDAVLTLRHAMGISLLESVVLFGDMDGNGRIGILDAVLILRKAMGITV